MKAQIKLILYKHECTIYIVHTCTLYIIQCTYYKK